MKLINKLLILLSSLVLGSLVSVKSVKASEVTTYFTGWYWDRQAENYHGSGSYKYYYVDGVDSYCLEPTTHEGSPIYQSDLAHSGIPDNLKERVLLIAYYGYNYPNHQTLEYRAATQALIWEAIGGGNVIFTSAHFGEGSELSVIAEKNEINRLINNHYAKPSFSDGIYNVAVGQSLVLEDTNDVLSNFNIRVSGGDYSVDGNKLIITPTTSGNVNVSLSKKMVYSSEFKIFVSDTYQNMVIPGTVDPYIVNLRIKAYYGKVSITKKDSETGTSQGMGVLEGAKYGVYKSDTDELITTLITDASGNATSDNVLTIGDYYIKEISNSNGYKLDSTKYNFTIDGTTEVHLNVNEDVIKGKIRILKNDSETNSCSSLGDASMVGAVYKVINSQDKEVDTITIGDDCIGVSRYLPYDKYKVKEVQAPNGYLIDSNTYDVNINSDNIVIDVTSVEKVKKGKIKIMKIDNETNSCSSQGQSEIRGAKYKIMDSKNNVVEILTIGDDCSATSKDLPYGVYKIQEETAPIGYNIDNNIYDANINEDGVVINVTSKEQVKKSKIKVIKNDYETHSCTIQGQTSFAGTKYQIIDFENNVVDTITIGDDCTGVSKDLPYGTYKVKEIEKPIGYEIDNTIYTIDIKNNSETISVTSYEKAIKNYISILKQFDYVDGNSTLLNAESNITFEIYDNNNIKYSEIVTDKNGYATIELPYGVWKFHQVNTNTGFEKIYDFYVTVNENTEKEQYYNILNNKLSAYLQLIKVDSETGNQIKLAGTKFKILNLDTNQYVSQFVGGKVYNTFETNEEGIMTTYLKLEAGNYRIVEISAPNHYLINDDGLTFTIGDNTHYSYTTYGTFVTIVFSDNVVKGKIIVNKQGEELIAGNGSFYYTNIDLGNVTFNIYASEDIMSSDGNYMYFEKDMLVDTITTDYNGYAISNELPLGEYYIVETSVDDKYILDSEKYYFELEYKDSETPIVYMSFNKLNYLKKGTLEFTKNDLTDGKLIPNTKVEIFTENDKLIFSGVTDEEGKIIITDLALGKYYIIETEASTGYKISDEKVYFEIKDNNEIVKANMTNEKITGTLEFTKQDFSTSESLPNTKIEIYDEGDNLVYEGTTDEEGKIVIPNIEYGKYYILEKEAPQGYVLNEDKMFFEILEDGVIVKSTMKDKKITGTLEFTKQDFSTSESLPNTKIEIYDEGDNLVYDGTTDEEGKIVISNIEYGKYYILEKEAPQGYVLNEDKMFFEILEDGVIVKSTMKDKKITGTLEFTKQDFSTSESLPNTKIEIYDEEDNLVYEGTTDEEGKIVIPNIEYGKYYILEKDAPQGYILNDDKMFFEILEDGVVVKSTMKDEKIKSKVIIHKTDNENKALESVTIGIYDLEDNLVYEGITDIDGNIEVELEYGKYYYKEIATIDGFVMDESKVFFDVEENDKTLEFNLINIKEEIDVPDTQKNRNIFIDIFACALFILGIGLVVCGTKNDKK